MVAVEQPTGTDNAQLYASRQPTITARLCESRAIQLCATGQPIGTDRLQCETGAIETLGNLTQQNSQTEIDRGKLFESPPFPGNLRRLVSCVSPRFQVDVRQQRHITAGRPRITGKHFPRNLRGGRAWGNDVSQASDGAGILGNHFPPNSRAMTTTCGRIGERRPLKGPRRRWEHMVVGNQSVARSPRPRSRPSCCSPQHWLAWRGTGIPLIKGMDEEDDQTLRRTMRLLLGVCPD